MDRTHSFGYWLRRRRKALDLTQAELAQRASCSLELIQKIEADARRPSRQMAEKLADVLGVGASERAEFVQAARAERAVDALAVAARPLAAQPGEPAALQPLIKGYELGQILGTGGFGAVYRAVQPGVDRDVAIKIIRPELANHPAFIRRFEAEAQLVSRLEHPYIVPLYDYWREAGGAYLVMRYMGGGSLHAALRDGAWPLDRITRLLDQVGAALAFAHRRGVVHRDLKPANLLLDEEGNVYLADFGIAKDLHAAGTVEVTQPGAIVGSPAYLSPEQLRDEPVTSRSDIYSLGVLLYELLTGASPFTQLSSAEQISKQLYEPLPVLRARRAELPDALDAIVQRATAKAPADRYPDVAGLFNAWQQAVARAALPVGRDGYLAPDDRQVAIEQAPATDEVTLIDLAALENPYKGLRAFGEADAADFFGRADLTQRLLERLAEQVPAGRFLAVVGPSGSGKSSVVRAALLPALRRGGLPDSERWFLIEMLPGAHPLEELEAALLRIAVNPPPSLIEQLQADDRGLARAVKRVLPPERETELLLVIDQFEELFTLTADEQVRAHVLRNLCGAVLDPHSRLRVVVTLRADFYDRPLLYAGFGDLVRERTEVVLPLTAAELEQAIVGPAGRAGVAPEPDLVATIVQDVGAQPATLPLLQYALTELFERRDGRALTLAAYRATGGVRGALARRADEVYAALDAAGQAATRQLFLRLVTLGEGVEDTRRRVARGELSTLAGDEGRKTDDGKVVDSSSFVVRPSLVMNAVIERYDRARLLSFDRDPITRAPTVEVAHEALIRTWGRLREWLDASRADVRAQRVLAGAAADWNAAGRDASYLLVGARLAQFEGWAAQTDIALTVDERAFLEASLAERAARDASERARQQHELEQAQALAQERTTAAGRLRRRAIFLAGALALALVAAVAAGLFARTAQENFAQSEHLRLVGAAKDALDSGESSDVPALLAIRSLRYSSTAQAFDTLRAALARPFTRQRFAGHTDAIGAVAYSPDGKTVLTGSADGTARLWNADTGESLIQFKGHTAPVNAVAFSPDGTLVLTGSADKSARLWDAATGAELRRFKGQSDEIWTVAFSPDGKQIYTGGKDYLVRQWDAATGQQLQFFLVLGAVQKIAIAPDGKHMGLAIVSTYGGPSVQIWDLTSRHKVRYFIGHTDIVTDVAFTPDGSRLVSASVDKTVRVWDAQTGREIRKIEGLADVVQSLAVSPDGQYLLMGSRDGSARLWELASGQQLRAYGHVGVVLGVAFSPDGGRILTGGTDKTAQLWDTLPVSEPLNLIGHTETVAVAGFSPDGGQVLTGSADTTARLWDAQTGRQLHVFSGHRDAITSVAFSPDGRYVFTGASTLDQTVRMWDVQTGRQLRVFQHGEQVISIILSLDGTRMFTASIDGIVRQWDVTNGQEKSRFTVPTTLNALAESPDQRYLLTGSDDNAARLWDAQTYQQLQVFSGHTAGVLRVAFSPDSKYVLTGSRDETARLWDVRSGRQLRVFSNRSGWIWGVAFSPDGKQVLTGGVDQTIWLWDAQTGQELRALRGHTGLVYTLAFSPDGKSVLSASADKTTRLWHLDDQDLVRIACAALSRDLSAEERATYGITDTAPTCPRS